MKRIFLVLLILNSFVLNSCKDLLRGESISEGVIEYKVTYPYLDSNNVLLKFMPQNMTMFFKDDVYKQEFTAGMGLFKTGYIVENKFKEMDYFLKLINVKYHSIYGEEEAKEFNSTYADYEVEFLDETKEIAGYKCNKANIIFNNKNNPGFSVYYTDRIQLTNPNWCNPLNRINGVMLEYELERYDLTMHFTADKIYNASIKESDLVVPDDYEEISNKRMEYKIKETFLSFQE